VRSIVELASGQRDSSVSARNLKLLMGSNQRQLPTGPLIGWYGDDFTGAAAVMEVLTFNGLPSVLFLEVPDTTDLERFPDIRGIGIASTARAMSPAELDTCLPPALQALADFEVPIIHYKVCTTLDSAPEIGSIGRALEIGANVLQAKQVPVLIAAPPMRRYQSYGHLYASFDGCCRASGKASA